MDIAERQRYDSDLRKFCLHAFNEKLSELGQDACECDLSVLLSFSGCDQWICGVNPILFTRTHWPCTLCLFLCDEWV
jgi:hypothetical protein